MLNVFFNMLKSRTSVFIKLFEVFVDAGCVIYAPPKLFCQQKALYHKG